jgi:hypothetical protein
MNHTPTLTGWIPTGFQCMVLIWAWLAAVVLNGLLRSVYQPEPDPVRRSGPIDS